MNPLQKPLKPSVGLEPTTLPHHDPEGDFRRCAVAYLCCKCKPWPSLTESFAADVDAFLTGSRVPRMNGACSESGRTRSDRQFVA
jgi:hypothetical protein